MTRMLRRDIMRSRVWFASVPEEAAPQDRMAFAYDHVIAMIAGFDASFCTTRTAPIIAIGAVRETSVASRRSGEVRVGQSHQRSRASRDRRGVIVGARQQFGEVETRDFALGALEGFVA